MLWSDLGEVRTIAVHPQSRGKGMGHAIVDRLLDVLPGPTSGAHLRAHLRGRVLFPARLRGDRRYAGDRESTRRCRSYDTGVAGFLDLSYVKPNILGNTRMLLTL